MKEQNQFSGRKLLTTSMIAAGVGLLLFSLSLSNCAWKADREGLGEEHEQLDSPALELEEVTRTYNLYDHAPEGFEEYVKYDWSRSVDEQLTARYFSRGEKKIFLDFIDQYDRRAWIFYHPYSLDTYIFMGHLIE